mmetsp:Transcript_12566/g.38782  ORF Transcript_12566/g.38782 Transcript_12566/m.38782 type:complete len:261 (-) Transcript_12566:76-858(-)
MSWWKTSGGEGEADHDENQPDLDAELFGPAAARTDVVRLCSRSSISGQSPRGAYRERVLVRVYDLGRTFLTRWHNKLTRGYGAFHTGVELYGREWSFGMTFDDWSTGVTWNLPMQNPDHSFRETLTMGYTHRSPQEVMHIIDELKMVWKGSTYNVLSRNCHNFSDELCGRLGVTRLPAWINDLAYTGAEAVEYLDTADSGYDGGAAVVDLWSSLKSSIYSTFTAQHAPSDHDPMGAKEEARERQRLPPQHEDTCWGLRHR